MPTATTGKGAPPVLLDTSTAVAFVVEDHEAHEAVVAAARGRRLGLAGHAWFETYSVLTRLPAGRRRSPADVLRILEHDFQATVFLSADAARALGPELARGRISGGAVYDAMVGAAAREHGLTLLTADARAMPTYESMGVFVERVRSIGARQGRSGPR
jgi:predicted nucleic acid-binding protein